MSKLPTVESIGRGFIEVTPGAGPCTPETIHAAAAAARLQHAADVAAMFDVPDGSAPPAPPPPPAPAHTATATASPPTSTDSPHHVSPNATLDKSLPSDFAECLKELKRVQAENSRNQAESLARDKRITQLSRQLFIIQNAPLVAAPRDCSNDGIWATLKASPEIKKASAPVIAAYRAWQEKVDAFTKAGLTGNAKQVIRQLENEVLTCKDPDALRGHAAEIAALKTITRTQEDQAGRVIQEAFLALYAPVKALLNLADDALEKLEHAAVLAETSFFQKQGLHREPTSVSRRFIRAREHIAHERAKAETFKGQGGNTSIVRVWNPPAELCEV